MIVDSMVEEAVRVLGQGESLVKSAKLWFSFKEEDTTTLIINGNLIREAKLLCLLIFPYSAGFSSSEPKCGAKSFRGSKNLGEWADRCEAVRVDLHVSGIFFTSLSGDK